MKIPFLNARINGEFNIFLTELEASIQQSVSQARQAADKELYACIYPLFVMLRCLSSSTHARDPSRDIVLTELRLSSKKKEFLEAVAHFKKDGQYSAVLKNGLQRQVFTGYFQELFSDALLLLNSYYSNNYRGAHIALRCMLEDLYRHLYYRDHPQEYWSVSDEGNSDEMAIGIRPRILREYLKRTNYLKVFTTINTNFQAKADPKEQTLFEVNEFLYSRCSAAVHGSGDSSHNSFESNLDLTRYPDKAQEILDITKQFCDVAICFLISAHIDQFIASNEYERSLVLGRFSHLRRAALRKVLNI